MFLYFKVQSRKSKKKIMLIISINFKNYPNFTSQNNHKTIIIKIKSV